MVEQLKAVWGESVTYASRVKGSRKVVLVWKWEGQFSDVNGSLVEIETMRVGQTLQQFMSNTFVGDILPVTGLPGHR